MNKEAVRKEISKKLKKLSDPEKEWASGAICDALSGIREFKEAGSVFVFMNSETEPCTEEITGLALMAEKTVAVPKIRGEEMDAKIITPYTDFFRNKWGILEPVSEQNMEEIDVAVIPLIAFDGLNRLGHGKGYYDRFLSSHDCFKIGIAFDIQEYKGIEVTPLDIPLDMLITEKRIITEDGEKENIFG